jgi:hypothetical protein
MHSTPTFRSIMPLFTDPRLHGMYRVADLNAAVFLTNSICMSRLSLKLYPPVILLPDNKIYVDYLGQYKKYRDSTDEVINLFPQITKRLFSTIFAGLGASPVKVWERLHENAQRWIAEHPEYLDYATMADINKAAQPMLFYAIVEHIWQHKAVSALHAQLYLPQTLYNRLQQLQNHEPGWFAVGNITMAGRVLTLSSTINAGETATLLSLPDNMNSEQVINACSENPELAQVVADTLQEVTELKEAIDSNPAATLTESIPKPQLNIHGSVRGRVINSLGVAADINIESTTVRVPLESGAYEDIVSSRASLDAAQAINNLATQYVRMKGVKTNTSASAGTGTRTNASVVIDEPLILEKKAVNRTGRKKDRVATTTHTFAQIASEHRSKSDKGVQVLAREDIVQSAVEVEAPRFVGIADRGRVIVSDATEVRQTQRNSKKVQSYERTASSKGAKFNVDELVLCGAFGVAVQNVTSTAKSNVLYAPDGQVVFLLGRKLLDAVESRNRSSFLVQTSKTVTKEQVSFQVSEFAGEINVYAREIAVEEVSSKTLEFLGSLNNHNDANIHYKTLDEYTKIDVKSKSKPGAGLTMLVAVAVTVATQGACSALAVSLVANSAVQAALAAGMSSLCGQAAAALVMNKGDPLKAIDSLNHSSTVKSVAAAMLTSGILNKTCEILSIPQLNNRELLEHVQLSLARASVTAAIDISINHEDMDKALLEALGQAAIGSVTGALISNVLQQTNAKELIALQQLIIETIAGGVQGATIGSQGFVNGALAGLVSALVANMVTPAAPTSTRSSLAGDKEYTPSSMQFKDITGSGQDAQPGSRTQPSSNSQSKQRSVAKNVKSVKHVKAVKTISTKHGSTKHVPVTKHAKHTTAAGNIKIAHVSVVGKQRHGSGNHRTRASLVEKGLNFLVPAAYAAENNSMAAGEANGGSNGETVKHKGDSKMQIAAKVAKHTTERLGYTALAGVDIALDLATVPFRAMGAMAQLSDEVQQLYLSDTLPDDYATSLDEFQQATLQRNKSARAAIDAAKHPLETGKDILFFRRQEYIGLMERSVIDPSASRQIARNVLDDSLVVSGFTYAGTRVASSVANATKLPYLTSTAGTRRGLAAFLIDGALGQELELAMANTGFMPLYGARGVSRVAMLEGNAAAASGCGGVFKKPLPHSRKNQMDFTPTGFLDGQFYPQEKLPKLYEYLRKRGADIQPIPIGAQGPGFRACDPRTGKPTLYLSNNPTVLEVKHELSHYLDCKKLGVEKYSSLSRLEKEQMVLDRLRHNRIWQQVLNDRERDFSKAYVNDLNSALKEKMNYGVHYVE